jgi:hypothetical protein
MYKNGSVHGQVILRIIECPKVEGTLNGSNCIAELSASLRIPATPD